jgi:RHS repeat-associated protein
LKRINAVGQRVRKTTGGVSTYFFYDEAGHLIGEYGDSGNLIQETIWFEDIPVATLRPNGSGGVAVFYVHTDHLNAPRTISRPADNVVVWRWDSDPFGVGAANEDADGDSVAFSYALRFPGQYFDAETGLHYNYFRDYDPSTGRYVQSDPIGLKSLRFDAVSDLYGYVEGDPIGNVDPFGLETAQITVRYPLPPPSGPVSWGIGGCLITFCIDWNSNDADATVSVPFPPELGGGISLCQDPEPSCDEASDRGGGGPSISAWASVRD